MSFSAMKAKCHQVIRQLEEKAGAGVGSWDEYQKLVAQVRERRRMIGDIDEMIEAQRKRGEDTDE